MRGAFFLFDDDNDNDHDHLIITVLDDGYDDSSVCSDDQIFALYLDLLCPYAMLCPYIIPIVYTYIN